METLSDWTYRSRNERVYRGSERGPAFSRGKVGVGASLSLATACLGLDALTGQVCAGRAAGRPQLPALPGRSYRGGCAGAARRRVLASQVASSWRSMAAERLPNRAIKFSFGWP
jgi:hypothetical protein